MSKARPNFGTFPLRPESELLVWCARTVVPDNLLACIRQRAQELRDWSIIVNMARSHGLVPLLYRTLSTIASDLVPTEALIRLRQLTQAGTVLNRALAKELVVLCEAFAMREIPVTPIKGATLAVSAYDDLALRDFTDLDLLVPESSLREAKAILLAHGYEAKGQSAESRELWESECEGGGHHVFIKRRALSRVDLQWQMVQQHFAFRLDRPEFWRRQASVAFENKVIP